MKIRILSLIISFSILVLLIYFSDINQMISIMASANPLFILGGFLTSIFLLFIRSFRWQLLLKRLEMKINFKRIFSIFSAGYYISNITPAKSGDVFRNLLLKKEGHSFSKSLPSTFIERIFDFLVLISLSVIGIFFIQVPLIQGILSLVIVIYTVLIFLGLYISMDERRTLLFFNKLYHIFRWLPKIKILKNKITHMALNYNKSFIRYKGHKTLITVLFLSIIIWLMETIIVQFAFYSVGLSVDFLSVLFILTISVLIGVASSLPGGLGSQEAVMILMFTLLFEFALPITTAAILISRFMGIWMNIIVGAIFLGFKT